MQASLLPVLTVALMFVHSSTRAEEQSKQETEALYFRNWNAKTGGFSVDAALIRADNTTASLQKKNGSTIDVPIARLSETDRKYLSGIEDTQTAAKLLSEYTGISLPEDIDAIRQKASDGDREAKIKARELETLLKKRENLRSKCLSLATKGRNTGSRTALVVLALAMTQPSEGVNSDNLEQVHASYTEASKLLQESADLGDPQAMFHLGGWYANGLGVPQDIEKAMELTKQAAGTPHLAEAANQRLEEWEAEQKLQMNKQQLRESAPLILLSWQWSESNGYAQVVGEVRNNTTSTLNNVEAVATFLTSSGAVVDTGSALIELHSLLPNQVSSFKVYCSQNPAMESCKIIFKQLLGKQIPTFDASKDAD